MSNMLRHSSRKKKSPPHIHQDRVISASRGQLALTIASRMVIPPAAAPVTSRMMVTATTPASSSLSTVGDVAHDNNTGKISYPVGINKASDDLAKNVSQNLKQKIVAGEFIDLALLLTNSSASDLNNSQKISFIQGELVIQPKQTQHKFTTIETWTDSFIIYMSIYCSVHIEKFPEILKYLHVINLRAKMSSFGWKSYDEQFRLGLSHNPSV